MNISARFCLIFLVVSASRAFAGGSAGGFGKPSVVNRPGNLSLDIMDSALFRLNPSESISSDSQEEIKATIDGRVMGMLGKSTYLSVTRKSFDLLKESMENDDPVTERSTNREYIYSGASESAISLESLSDDQNVIVLPSDAAN
ncbi:MAG: hypothetical protein EOP04_00625 [Proteobacteria bacterium]|nr:MAG: hypothetical protein EOP04_00625 [Pseudomonadota bacterium]